MPINGLTDRPAQFARLGVLRKGAPKPEQGNKPGADLKHFRFDSKDASAVKAFYDAYGDEPNDIRVYLPYATTAQNFQTWKEEWKASSMVRRCDGCFVQIARAGAGYSHTPTSCLAPNCGCKAIGRLSVIVQDLKRLAYVEAQTTSLHDIMELQRNLEAVEGLRGDLRGIPFILSRKPRMISTPRDGQRVRAEKWLMSIEPAPDWVALQLTAMQRAALPGGTDLMLSEPDDEDDEVSTAVIEPTSVTITTPPAAASPSTNKALRTPAQLLLSIKDNPKADSAAITAWKVEVKLMCAARKITVPPTVPADTSLIDFITDLAQQCESHDKSIAEAQAEVAAAKLAEPA